MRFQKHKPKIKTHRPSKNFHVTLFYEDLESTRIARKKVNIFLNIYLQQSKKICLNQTKIFRIKPSWINGHRTISHCNDTVKVVKSICKTTLL